MFGDLWKDCCVLLDYVFACGCSRGCKGFDFFPMAPRFFLDFLLFSASPSRVDMCLLF